MSPSENTPQRTLIIDTKTLATEITVIDSAGHVVAASVRRLESALVPALYKIRYRIGNHVEDQLIELPPGDGPYEVAVPPLPIQSAAPLPDATDEAASARFAQELIARQAADTSKPASLLIFIAAIPESANDPSDLPSAPGTGISVHTFSGEKIGDLASAETRSGCCGWTLPVDPGPYLLRVEMPPGRPVEQTLVAVAGWQVQFYARVVKSKARPTAGSATSAPEATPRFEWQLDLNRCGVLLLKKPALGLPDPEQMKWTAAARQALAAGRSKAAPNEEMIKALLAAKFENPMLGIYAGHLLAMQNEPNALLLREVVDNLTSLVGDHPDVTPLLIPLKDKRAESIRYSAPPMLRRSWSMIVEASTPKRDLRVPRSYAARIGGNLWGGGAWLVWRMPEEIPAAAQDSPDVLPVLYAQAASGKLTEAIRHLTDSESAANLTSVEATLLRYLDLASNQLRVAQKFSTQDDQRSWLGPIYPFVRSIVDSDLLSDTKKTFTSENLMKLTGLPYSTITEGASSLASKLGVTASPSVVSQVFGSLKLK